MGALGPSEPQIGEVLARKYELRSVIGRGGFGVVYEALHLGINRKIALKILLPEFMDKDADLAIRFRREALLASELRHPNTITLYDYGQAEDGILYMAMEFVEGRTLSNVLRDEAPVPAHRVIHIARQILGSLHEAHQRGIIHRDLKPGNIMLTRLRGDTDFVKVLDFGIAKAVSSDLLSQPEVGQTLTQEGRFCGTPRYMAPEQFRNTPISTSVDLYSLGLICYELLTGLPAVSGETMVDLIVAQVTSPDLTIPPRIAMPEHQREALHKALRKNPAERFDTALAFLSALEEPSTRDSLPDLGFLMGSDGADDAEDFTVEFPPDANALAKLVNANRPGAEAATNPAVKARGAPTPRSSPQPTAPASPAPPRDKRTEKELPAVATRPTAPPRTITSTSGVPAARRSVELDRVSPLGAGNGKPVSVVRPSSRAVEPVPRLRATLDPQARPLLDEELDTTPIALAARQAAPAADDNTGESTHPQPRRAPARVPAVPPTSDPDTTSVETTLPQPRPRAPVPSTPRPPRPSMDEVIADATIEIRPSDAFRGSNFSDEGEATIDIAASDMLSERLKEDYHEHIERRRDDDPPPLAPPARPRRPPQRGPSANPSAFYNEDDDGPTTRIDEEKALAAIRLAQKTAPTHRLSAVPAPTAAAPARRFPLVPVIVAAIVALVLGAGCVAAVLYGWEDAPPRGAVPQQDGAAGSAGKESEFVTIDIHTTPRSATVFVDQVERGITPKTITCRRDQKVVVTLKKDGYLTRTDQILCTDDGKRTYTLSKPDGAP